MRRLLVLLAVGAIVSSAWGASAELRVELIDQKPGYGPGDTITIEVVADFEVYFVSVDSITTNNGGTASGFEVHPNLKLIKDPGITNSGGILIENIDAIGDPSAVPIGEFVLHFEYLVPSLPDSTIIIIDTVNVALADAWYSEYVDSLAPLELHVTPEPATLLFVCFGIAALRKRRLL